MCNEKPNAIRLVFALYFGKAFRQCVIKDSSGFHFSVMASMAAYSAKMHVAASLSCRPKQVAPRFSGFKAVSFGQQRYAFTSLRSAPFNSRSLHILCAAKPETVSKVCEIVKSQLALSDDKTLTPESKFADLGADSLDTVEIVMALEEEFKVSVEEENAGSITTVQDAADLIDRLVESGAAVKS